MKSLNLLSVLAVTALAAFTFNVSAGDAFLTPRAKENQMKRVPTVAGERNLATENRNLTISPRDLANRPKVAQGTTDSVNLASAKCTVVASPKQLETMGRPGAAGCCKIAVARCTMAGVCCAMK